MCKKIIEVYVFFWFLLIGHHKCRDQWPADWKDLERVFNVLLDVVLLVLPLLMLGSTYSLITHTLWKGMLAERMSRRNSRLDVEQSEKGRNASQLGKLL